MRSAALSLLLVLPLVAEADTVLADDFEGATRLRSEVPPGAWNSLDRRPGCPDTVTPLAAHRDLGGLRIDDQSAATGSGDMTAYYATFTAPLTTQAHLRFWFRLSTNNDRGSLVLGELLRAASGSACDVTLRNPGALLGAAGANADATFSSLDSGVRLSTGAWHLVECGVRGLGTTAGERWLALDAQVVAREANLDFRNTTVSAAAVGQPYAMDLAFSGALDFDDVRVGDAPQAARWSVDGGASSPGACVPWTIGLLDSEGSPTVLPFDALLSYTAQRAMLFADPLCLATLPALFLPAGDSTLTVYLRATGNSPASLDVAFVDVLPGGHAVVVGSAADAGASTDAGVLVSDAGLEMDAGVPVADAGLDPTMRSLGVGCGCASADGALAWLLLALTSRGTRAWRGRR